MNLCDSCLNRESDKHGLWCMALHDMKKHNKSCRDYEEEFVQGNIWDMLKKESED